MDFLHVITSIAGGIALLSYSMSLMSRSLHTAFGNSLKEAIRVACTNRVTAFLSGTVATAVLTSATATSLLVLQFVQNGDMTFIQSLGVSLGINVGSTLNAHLLAFQIHRYGMLLVAVGYLLQVLSRSKMVKHIGDSILGLGLLFLSIVCMSEGMAPLNTYKPFLALLAHMANPILAMMVSGVFAVVFQSSNTVIAVAIMLGQQGFLTLDVATYFVLGSNVGTCFTSLIASIGKKREALQSAVAYLFFKLVGIILLLPFLSTFLWMLESSTSTAKLRAEEQALANALASGVVLSSNLRYEVAVETLESIREAARRAVLPLQIANAHTLVNVFIALVFFPFTEAVGRLVQALVPAQSKLDRDLHFNIDGDGDTEGQDGVQLSFDRNVTGIQHHNGVPVRRRPADEAAPSPVDDSGSETDDNKPLLLASGAKRR